MKIPVIKFTQSKKQVPLILLEIVRCPDGIYGICVLREYHSIQDRVLHTVPISQLLMDEEYYPELLSFHSEDDTLINRIEAIETSLKETNNLLSKIAKQGSKDTKPPKKVLNEDKKSGT